ncbi:DsbA family protein [Sandarakinorhabdus limnophila]|uniref:DsbA family protein n=1 Tax=Sandarakinorhabdus limnophila TaxID=210512 RepID=UPI0026EB3568|nr:DsbA family protein [Sandarakinorhabdus limnophila]MCM0032879.1 DsbA family protein [Sandarakinorhabdus limnophila]
MIEKFKSRRTIIVALIAGLAILVALAADILWPTPASVIPVGGTRTAADATKSADEAVAAAGMSPAERKATESLVKAYILENPEIINDAVAIFNQRQVGERLSAVRNELTKPFPGAEAGNPNGDVTIVEFYDYNCGYCRASLPVMKRLLKSDGNIHLVYRELPILSPTSRLAALWAIAAARQGKHELFHDALFARGRADDANIAAAAQTAGLDIAAARSFAVSLQARQEIERNLAVMQQIGFNGTPTFIIGDQIIEGALGYEALQSAVAKAREKS